MICFQFPVVFFFSKTLTSQAIFDLEIYVKSYRKPSVGTSHMIKFVFLYLTSPSKIMAMR